VDFFKSIVIAALISGFVAGVALTGLQTLKVYPLIFAAEEFENAGAEAHDHASHDHTAEATARQPASATPFDAKPAPVKPAGHHGDNEWMPEEGLERLFFSFLSNVLISIGFGLVLSAIFALGHVTDWRHGLAWGFCAFVAVNLAPALGMPPELPGMPAGDLIARQTWWWATVLLTSCGMALIYFSQTLVWRILGIAAIALPHIYGAPKSLDHSSNVPAYLAGEFATASLSTNLVFWVILGVLAALAIARQDDADTSRF
jgi:cobalt transporter subunit CbtA